MKIRIIGSCGSGKSYLSRNLSKKFMTPHYEIDNMIWDRSAGNRRYPEEERNSKFFSIVDSDSWIIEGVQYKWTDASFREADLILILNPNVFLRDYRIIKRFIRSRLGLETWNYKQSFQNLIKMIVKWNHEYNLDEVFELTENYSNKRVEIKTKEEAIRHIQRYLEVTREGNDIT